MYDSTNPFDIPTGRQLVAGYIDGAYAWSQAGWARHQGAVWVPITVFGDDLGAKVADIENGTMTVQKGVDWARRKILQGDLPTLYFSLSLFGAVQAEINRIGITPSEWAVWAADWTLTPHLLPGTYATQYDHPPTSGGHWDLSLVADYWPGVDAGAPPPPAPTPPKYATVNVSAQGGGHVTVDGSFISGPYVNYIGQTVVFAAVADPGSVFLRWEGTGGQSTANPLQVTLSAPTGDLVALFGLASGGGSGPPLPGGTLPPPASGAPVDSARQAWADLGTALTSNLSSAASRIDAARGNLEGQI
jgi:hypothetical protein